MKKQMCLSIYMCCVVIIWAKFGHSSSYCLGQFVFNIVCQNTIKYGFLHFFEKIACEQFKDYYLGQVGLFLTPNLAQIITLTWPK